MEIEAELEKFKGDFDRELKRFLDFKVAEAKKISPVAYGMARCLEEYVMNGGKRIRPALMYYTYFALSGRSAARLKKEVLKAGMALEFMHTFLLIHDDIIDRDALRRGKPSVHYVYKMLARKNRYSADADHYGNSQAISIGDMCFGFTNEIIASTKFSPATKDKLSRKISEIIFNTTIGQFYDVFAASAGNGVTVKDILTILEYKTARYTIEGPLHLGAIMAGSKPETLKKLAKFAIPLGVAFQIQDDILGVFGTSKETGKPVGADIREGKKTLLVVKALELASVKDKKELRSILGNPRTGAKDIRRAREIIIKTGSLEYSQKLLMKLVEESCDALRHGKFGRKSEEFFADVADFTIKRNH